MATASKDKTDGKAIVFRVKRKRTEDPVEALVVSHVIPSKKAHLVTDDSEHSDKENDRPSKQNITVDQLFRFVGTVSEGDDSRSKRLLTNLKTKPLAHDDLKKTQKGAVDKIQNKLRQEKKESHQHARFKLISSNRPDQLTTNSNVELSSKDKEQDISSPSSSDDSTDAADNEVQRLFRVYDVIRDEEVTQKRKKDSEDEQDTSAILCNSVKMMREKLAVSDEQRQEHIAEKGYVYDFYYANDSHRGLGDVVQITGVDENFTLETVDREFDEMFDDEDDSNDENNWRNDYPDEDDLSSGEENKDKRLRCSDYGFDIDDDAEKYHKKAFGEDLSSDDDELDCYSKPYKFTVYQRSEVFHEEISDGEMEGF